MLWNTIYLFEPKQQNKKDKGLTQEIAASHGVHTESKLQNPQVYTKAATATPNHLY